MPSDLTETFVAGAACEPPPRLKFALLSTQSSWGGGENQAMLLCRGMEARGHRCLVFARRGGQFSQRMAAAGFHVVTFEGRGTHARNIWKLRWRLRRFRPDLLYLNDSHALTGGGLAAFGLKGIVKLAARRVDFPIRSRLNYRLLADRIVCVSRSVASACRAARLPESQIAVVRDGVDPRRASGGERERTRRELGLQDDQPLLLTVAALTDCKGHTYLLEALPTIIRRHPQLRLALAGDGVLRDRLENQARELGVQRHVLFLGFRSDVADLYAASDLFVLPSHTEGLCTSLIDAMFAFRPIVTTSAGGIPDLVGPLASPAERAAWLVPPRDATSLAGAILQAMEFRGQTEEYCRRALSRARREFTADRMVEETLAVYDQVIGRARVSPRPVRRKAA